MADSTCCIMLKPCPSGDILYIKAGSSTGAYASSWTPFIGNRVTINIDIYSGITWYVVGLCCKEENVPNCKTYGECSQNSIESIPIAAVTQVGTGDCPTFKTNVCCVKLYNCQTGQVISAVMNTADVPFWGELFDNSWSVTLEYYNIPGIWNVENICCNYDDPTYGNCGDGSCSINNFYIDPNVVTLNTRTVNDAIENIVGCSHTCYSLLPCDGGAAIYRSFDNSDLLYEYINTAITVQEIPGQVPAGTYYITVDCTYYPSYQDSCCNSAGASLVVTDSYADCACFLGPPPVKYTRVIPKPDRFFYKIDQSQCDITANIQFGEAYYRLFKNLKYGINDECDTLDLNKLWIKKELSDYSMMYDPTLCIGSEAPTTNCADPCNLTR